ncbi:hypothetical protein GINT2_001012 [Glugoides intestinalis]
MSATINQAYPLAALLVHATKQEVTKERIQAIFKTLELEFSPKVASFFELSADKLSSIISNIGGSAAPAAASNTNAATAAVKEVEPEEESSDAELAMDF